ncbi:hypothetical protein HYV43_06250 [Candidatus Micrarchaeota archaeon]|nr:hypothetical protein [Candidatus Micrarchaeota archaeon]
MNVLIVYEGAAVKPLADAIAQGAQELNATVAVKTAAEKPPWAGCDFVFAGGMLDKGFSVQKYLETKDVSKTKLALFCVKKGAGNLDLAVQTLQQKGAQVERNTFSAQLQGPLSFVGVGKLKDADLIRARGFGERTLNVAFSLGIAKDTEKADKIKGYVK